MFSKADNYRCITHVYYFVSLFGNNGTKILLAYYLDFLPVKHQLIKTVFQIVFKDAFASTNLQKR